MSGIAGFIHFDRRPADAELVQRMTRAMHYRGPDGMRHWVKGPAALGHCALVTTSEQVRETQPLEDALAGRVLVFDGRIDNRPELRRELLAAGVQLRDDSDAELVLRAFEQWNADCVLHIDGEFALVLWDARTASVFCARDRMGVRPFHYHWDGRTLTFASDVHAVLRMPWVPQRLNEGMVAEALAVEHFSRDETFWHGVHRLPAATSAVVTADGPRLRCYWEPDPGRKLPCKTEADYVHYHRELLRDVLRRQSRSHAPIACEVSGGLDSSAVFALGHALRREDSFHAPALHGFALSFSDPAADESSYRRALVDFVGEPIREVAPGHYPVRWYRDYGAMFRDFAGFPNWTMIQPLYAAARSAGCKVVLNGQGGDEWLGAVGDWRSAAMGAGRWASVLRCVAQDVRSEGCWHALAQVLRWCASEFLPETAKETIRYHRGLPVPSAWLSRELSRTLRRRRAIAGSPGDSIYDQQLALLRDADGQFGREVSERQGAVCGIERRQPFWDRRIVEAAFATPEWLRAVDGDDKWLHRRTMEGLLPPAILRRDDKADFLVMAQQQRGELADAMQSTLARRSRWVRPQRLRPPAEYVGRGARADFGQWALLMADALEAEPVAPSFAEGTACGFS